MNITEKIAATFEGREGEVLTPKQAREAVLAKFPEINPASLNLADRAASAGQKEQYADHLFVREGKNYKVLPQGDRVEKVGKRGPKVAAPPKAAEVATVSA